MPKPRKRKPKRSRVDHRECDAKIAELQARLAELERLLAQNSANSSKPPSSDPPHRPARKKKGSGQRKPGGQPGHPGKTRELLPPEQVDEIQEHKPPACERCGDPLSGEDPAPRRHQVTEVPPPRVTVTEHRLHELHCECGATTRATLPDGVPFGAFGPRLTALVGLLTGGYRVSKRNAQRLLRTCFGVQISLGSLPTLEATLSDGLLHPVEEAADHLRAEVSCVGMDETSWRIAGRRAWLWTATSPRLAVFRIRSSRGSDVAKELIGEDYQGHLISDRWSGYRWFSAARRQVCWSHLKRDFEKLVEAGDQLGKLGSRLQRARRRLFKWWHKTRDGTISRSRLQRLVKPLRAEVDDLLRQAGACTEQNPKLAGMAKEIRKLEPCLWTFTQQEGVEPTNNDAERSLRHAVIWRKTSFGTQSEGGTTFVERMLTTVTSLRLQGRDLLDFLTQACAATLGAASVPSLLPEPQPELVALA